MWYTYYDIIDNLQNERFMWWDWKDIYTNYSWMWEKWVWFDFSWGKDYAVENFFLTLVLFALHVSINAQGIKIHFVVILY